MKEKKSKIYVGEMTKDRVKDFIFDANDGRIYSIAVTFCRSKNRIQKQLEIEYAGYLPGFKNSNKNIEKQVVAGVQELSQYIHNNFFSILKPSVERKFEFVKRINSKT